MSTKGHMLQEPFLNALRKERIPVAIYLVNGIKLQGHVESFDQFDLSSLFIMLCMGAPLSFELKKKIIEKLFAVSHMK